MRDTANFWFYRTWCTIVCFSLILIECLGRLWVAGKSLFKHFSIFGTGKLLGFLIGRDHGRECMVREFAKGFCILLPMGHNFNFLGVKCVSVWLKIATANGNWLRDRTTESPKSWRVVTFRFIPRNLRGLLVRDIGWKCLTGFYLSCCWSHVSVLKKQKRNYLEPKFLNDQWMSF